MDHSPLGSLPDELLEAIVLYLEPDATVAFGSSCRRANEIIHEAVVWRRHCLQEWKYWHPRHEIADKKTRPPVQIKWRKLYQERQRIDRLAATEFSLVIQTQQCRTKRIEELAALGYDIKDLMLRLARSQDPPAEDELARVFYSKTVLGKIHREIAINTWDRLQKQKMVSLEQALGSYDLFGTAGDPSDLDALIKCLDKLAQEVDEQCATFHDMSTRQKAVEIATYLRSKDLLGNNDAAEYHALRNNYITLALMQTPHTSLPLQTAAIYCAVARRLGVDARPSNFPYHVYVVVKAPRDTSLDGHPRITGAEDSQSEHMHMDPWTTEREVDRTQLTSTLQQMGMQQATHASFLGPVGTADIVIRAGRNITTSVVEARNRARAVGPDHARRDEGVDVDRAWYSMLWSTMILGGPSNYPAVQQRRRSCLPYLMEHYTIHHPEDIGLLEQHIVPILGHCPEQESLVEILESARRADENKKAPMFRTATTAHVNFKVGTHFMHKRYGYTGVIIGWDARCEAGEQWINQMRVNDLPQGREQPFYNVLADDKSVRYVAQENIEVEALPPRDRLMAQAGRYFLRWDGEAKCFVSNIKEEYPDD